MKILSQVNIKNCQNYFFNSMTNIKSFDVSLLDINQVAFTSTDSAIYDIEYFKNVMIEVSILKNMVKISI